MKRLQAGVSLAALLCALGCARGPGELRLELREHPSPAAAGSGEPNLTATADGRALLSWIEPSGEDRHVLRFAERRAGGPWSEARTVAEGSGWFVNWADFPAVAALPDGTLFAHWLARNGPRSYDYEVRVTRSADGGRTWAEPLVPHRDETRSEHGFVSMAPWDGTAMGLVWLDGRRTAAASAAAPAEGAHSGHGTGTAAMTLMHTTLGTDGRLGAETVLDERVCDCCQTDMAGADGAVVVVYRDRSPREIRDMSVVRFAGGRWSAPQPLFHDGWEINGCPVNGPAIAAAGRAVAVAWFTAPEERARVNVAFSSDAGATFGAPIAVDDGRPLGRVDVVLLEDGTALVSWLEQVEGGAAVRVRQMARDGSRGAAVTVADSAAARSSGFPRMARTGGEVTVAWRDPSDPPRVRTAVLTLAR